MTQFTHYDLGYQERGAVVEVSLSSGANVRLMDTSNLNSYKNGRRHTYHGGLAKRTPVRLPVPRSGHWHVTVDVIGLRNGTRSSIRILPPPLPSIPAERPLAEVPSLYRDEPPAVNNPDESVFDVFISHASEDKAAVVDPLVSALRGNNLSVWYDDLELGIGDSLRRKIDNGLAKSRFAIVVLSPRFLSKGWTNYELDGIISRTVGGEQVILPIWHEITKQEVIEFSPSLADKVARNTASFTVEEIADEITQLIDQH